MPDREDAALEVVGEASYQRALMAAAGPLTPDGPTYTEHMAALVREPNNRYDPNAISVHIGGQLVGYLSRENAIAYGPVMRWLASRDRALAADAHLTGGWDRGAGDLGFIGVVLHLGSPAECMVDLVCGDHPLRTDQAWSGWTVAFTGDSHFSVGGVGVDRLSMGALAAKAGMMVHPRVTKKVQLVVLCEKDSQSGNATKARAYGIPTVSEGEFWVALGVDATDLGHGVHDWRGGR